MTRYCNQSSGIQSGCFPRLTTTVRAVRHAVSSSHPLRADRKITVSSPRYVRGRTTHTEPQWKPLAPSPVWRVPNGERAPD